MSAAEPQQGRFLAIKVIQLVGLVLAMQLGWPKPAWQSDCV
jgi:hypothetical protein